MQSWVKLTIDAHDDHLVIKVENSKANGNEKRDISVSVYATSNVDSTCSTPGSTI